MEEEEIESIGLSPAAKEQNIPYSSVYTVLSTIKCTVHYNIAVLYYTLLYTYELLILFQKTNLPAECNGSGSRRVDNFSSFFFLSYPDDAEHKNWLGQSRIMSA